MVAEDFKPSKSGENRLFSSPSHSPSIRLFCLATAGNTPPPTVLAFLFISTVSGGDGRSWCFINSPLLFALRPDRWQRIKENTAAAAEDYCFISCYFFFSQSTSDCLKMSKHRRGRKHPPRRLGGLLKNPFFFTPFPFIYIEKKASNRILFKAAASEFLAAFLLFLFEFWLERLIWQFPPWVNRPLGSLKGDWSRCQKYRWIMDQCSMLTSIFVNLNGFFSFPSYAYLI